MKHRYNAFGGPPASPKPQGGRGGGEGQPGDPVPSCIQDVCFAPQQPIHCPAPPPSLLRGCVRAAGYSAVEVAVRRTPPPTAPLARRQAGGPSWCLNIHCHTVRIHAGERLCTRTDRREGGREARSQSLSPLSLSRRVFSDPPSPQLVPCLEFQNQRRKTAGHELSRRSPRLLRLRVWGSRAKAAANATLPLPLPRPPPPRRPVRPLAPPAPCPVRSVPRTTLSACHRAPLRSAPGGEPLRSRG